MMTRDGKTALTRCSFGLLLAAGLLLSFAASADDLRIGGTGNALGTMRLLGEAFSKSIPNVQVNVLSSLGSSGALKAVPKGAIDLGLTSRALSDEERSTGIQAIEYARSATVFAVSIKSKITEITREQIADIYSGRLTNWPDGMPIRPILRQQGDDNTKQIRGLSPDIEKALGIAEQRPGLAFATTDQEAAEKLEAIPGAIGVTTVALIKSESRSLRALKLDGVEPTESNGASGLYPITKSFYLIVPSTPSSNSQQFITFVKSPAGRNILTQTGHWIP